jgi:hypothetical protein
MNEDIKKLVDLNKELLTAINSYLDKGEQPFPDTQTKTFVLLSFAKAYKTHGAILLLCEQGYGEDAVTLARTLLELSLYTLLVEQDKDGLYAKRYFDFDYVLQNEYYKQLIKNGQEEDLKKQITASGDPEATIENISKKTGEVLSGYSEQERGRKGKGMPHWSGLRLRRVAELVGKSYLYEKVYMLQCSIAHSDVKSANNYIRTGEHGLEIDVSPNENWVFETLVASLDCFGMIANAWNSTFNLGLEEQLKAPADKFNQLLGEINKKKSKD